MGYVSCKSSLFDTILCVDNSTKPRYHIACMPRGELYYKLLTVLHSYNLLPSEYRGSLVYLSIDAYTELQNVTIEILTDTTVSDVSQRIYWKDYMPLRIHSVKIQNAMDFTDIFCSAVNQALKREPCPHLYLPDADLNKIDIPTLGIVINRSKVTMWVGADAAIMASKEYSTLFLLEGVNNVRS